MVSRIVGKSRTVTVRTPYRGFITDHYHECDQSDQIITANHYRPLPEQVPIWSGDRHQFDLLASSSKVHHLTDKFPDEFRHRVNEFRTWIDHRIMYSTVARKPVFRNAIYAAATSLLPLRWPIPRSSAAVQWAT